MTKEVHVLSDVLTTVDTYTFVAEASALGLKPGEWPMYLRLTGLEQYTSRLPGQPNWGSQCLLRRYQADAYGGFTYLGSGLTLQVLND